MKSRMLFVDKDRISTEKIGIRVIKVEDYKEE